MPTAEELEPHVKEATLISLCSPLNPTGTCFSKNEIQKICDLVINENNRRGDDQKPLYVLFDQIYWQLTLGDIKHYNPVVINPEMRDYTIFVDGISKAFAATGVRVGWGYGPKRIIDKMKSITSHMGAWAPKAEQVAVSKFLLMDDAVDKYIAKYKSEILDRVNVFYKKFKELKNEGYNVDVIAPQASIFLTLKIDLTGYKKEDGTVIQNTKDITNFLIEDAHIALVPFASFGSSPDSKWFRVAVGTCTVKEIEEMMENFKYTLSKLTKA